MEPGCRWWLEQSFKLAGMKAVAAGDFSFQFLALTLSFNFWHSHCLSIFGTHTVFQFLTLTLFFQFWHSNLSFNYPLTDEFCHSGIATLTVVHRCRVWMKPRWKSPSKWEEKSHEHCNWGHCSQSCRAGAEMIKGVESTSVHATLYWQNLKVDARVEGVCFLGLSWSAKQWKLPSEGQWYAPTCVTPARGHSISICGISVRPRTVEPQGSTKSVSNINHIMILRGHKRRGRSG